MQKIIPHLWFDTQAVQAADFYCQVFPESQILHKNVLNNTPSGNVDLVSLKIWGHEFAFISAGPIFKINASVSFTVICKTPEELDAMWEQLKQDGRVLMELGEYPFSKRYGWVMDKFGVTWQLILVEGDMPEQRIVPALLFTQDLCGKAEEAINFYVSVFDNSKIKDVMKYGEHETPDTEGTIQHATFMLENQFFTAMDSAHKHEFKFNEAISFMVRCKTQEEIDYYWEKLSAVPESEQCGWLKDKFGFSWQIVPTAMDEMMKNGTKEQTARVTEAFLQMKKFDIAKLEEVYKA